MPRLAMQTEAAAKKARIDGSSNKEVTDDRSKELTARVEFTSETHIAKDPQPTAITTDLKYCIMAKLTYDEETGAESWDLGRVKDVVPVSVAAPDGQAQTNTHIIKWQIGLNGPSGLIYDLHVSMDGCGPKREWVLVEPKRTDAKGKAKAGTGGTKRKR